MNGFFTVCVCCVDCVEICPCVCDATMSVAFRVLLLVAVTTVLLTVVCVVA
jgi:hypothetical protein